MTFFINKKIIGKGNNDAAILLPSFLGAATFSRIAFSRITASIMECHGLLAVCQSVTA
jgi:hypothetical protein